MNQKRKLMNHGDRIRWIDEFGVTRIGTVQGVLSTMYLVIEQWGPSPEGTTRFVDHANPTLRYVKEEDEA